MKTHRLLRNFLMHSMLVCALMAPIWATKASAQCASTTQGKDFWLMFLENYDNNQSDLSLTITAAKTIQDDGTWIGVQVTIINQLKNWSKVISVPVGGSKTVTIPKSVAVAANKNNEVTKLGLHITASVDVSVYASNFESATFDIATVYPTNTLDTEYVVQAYDGLSGYGTEIGFVAVNYGTEISMRLPCALSSGSYKKGDSLTVELDKGETFLLSAANGGNLSGMRVTSNGQPFAMFQGTKCANVPSNCAACDHLYEQALPLKMWGQTYVIAPTAGHNKGDRAIVTAEFDSTVVTYDGTELCTLNAGQSKEFEVTSSKSHLMETTRPAFVCLYIKGGACNDEVGDPSAVIIPPVAQGLNRVRFQAIGTALTDYHYVNIIVPTDVKDSMVIDSVYVDKPFQDLGNGYSSIQLAVDTGTHTLYNNEGKFVAYFYGLGTYESYAYIAGMSLLNLRKHIFIEGVEKTNDETPYISCYGDEVHMSVDLNDHHDVGAWFVDGEYVHIYDSLATYIFETPGLHRVDVVAPNNCDTVTAYVYARLATDTIDGEVCFGDAYTIDTFSFNTTGVHTFAVKDNYGCDSLVTLRLTVIDSSFTVLPDTACFFETYRWQGRVLDSTGVYLDTLTSSHGCDSVVGVDLWVVERPAVTFSSESHCTDGTYTVEADLSQAATDGGGWPTVHWSSQPPDTMLVGHENEPQVLVKPLTTTAYILDVDYRCPFTETLTLSPVKVPIARMKVNPSSLDFDRTAFDAYDISENTDRRQWWVDERLAGEQGSALHCAVDIATTDSVMLMLVASDGTCSDTALRTIPVWHTGVYAPNVFTPTDYANPRFTVSVHDAELVSLSIFNRSGQQLYHNEENPGEGWDGTAAGTACPQGAYVWKAEYRRADSPTRLHTVTGNVTLLR